MQIVDASRWPPTMPLRLASVSMMVECKGACNSANTTGHALVTPRTFANMTEVDEWARNHQTEVDDAMLSALDDLKNKPKKVPTCPIKGCGCGAVTHSLPTLTTHLTPLPNGKFRYGIHATSTASGTCIPQAAS